MLAVTAGCGQRDESIPLPDSAAVPEVGVSASSWEKGGLSVRFLGEPGSAPEASPGEEPTLQLATLEAVRTEASLRLDLEIAVTGDRLSPLGHQVRATFDGRDFLLPYEGRYEILGLEGPTVGVLFELVDAQGVPVPGPSNRILRELRLPG